MNELAKQIADYIRTYEFGHGDQYGSWIGTSPDAEQIASAVEANFIRKTDIDRCPKCGEYLHDEMGHMCPPPATNRGA